MDASTKLWVLVRSLTSSEKRYIKLMGASQGENNQYVRLFDKLDEMDIYDEAIAYKGFKKEFDQENFRVLKNYLYNLILRGLRMFDEGKEVEAEIQIRIQEADLLERRGLYVLAKDQLKLAKRKALSFGKTYLLLAIGKRELSYLVAQEESFAKKFKEISVQFELLIQEIILENTAILNYYKFGSQSRRGVSMKKEEVAKLKAEWLKVKEDFQDLKLPFTARYFKILVDAYLAKMAGDKQKYIALLAEVVEIWRSEEAQIKAYPHKYRIYLANYLDNMQGQGDFSQSEAIIEELENLPTLYFNDEAEAFQTITHLKLFFYLNKPQLELAKDDLDEIEQGLKTYQEKINPARQLTFYYHISLLYYLLGNLPRAQHWLWKILNYSKSDHREDIRHFAQFLQLFYLHDEGSPVDASDKRHNLNRRLKRKGELSEFDDLIMKKLNKKLLHSINNKEKKEAFEEFKKSLSAWKTRQNGQTTFGYEETLLWINRNLKTNKNP